MTLAQGDAIAAAVVKELARHCLKIEVAGSIRRRRPEVTDVDIVVLTRWRTRVLERVSQTCTLKQDGKQNVRARMKTGTQLDLWFAREAGDEWFEPYPSNWGSVLLCRTGSMQHNIQLCAQAKSLGLHFDPYRGLLKGDKVVASKTEEEIYEALGSPYREPTNREVFYGAA